MTHFQRISVQNAKSLISSQQMAIVDVRDPQSYQTGHIQSAKHISPDSINQYISETDPSIPILVYCYHGNSSQSYAQFFVDQGFKEVYSLDGGYSAWALASS